MKILRANWLGKKKWILSSRESISLPTKRRRGIYTSVRPVPEEKVTMNQKQSEANMKPVSTEARTIVTWR